MRKRHGQSCSAALCLFVDIVASQQENCCAAFVIVLVFVLYDFGSWGGLEHWAVISQLS